MKYVLYISQIYYNYINISKFIYIYIYIRTLWTISLIMPFKMHEYLYTIWSIQKCLTGNRSQQWKCQGINKVVVHF